LTPAAVRAAAGERSVQETEEGVSADGGSADVALAADENLAVDDDAEPDEELLELPAIELED
ncbi:MAG: hypothetical protein ACRC50_07535, partial [Gaiella sp.]